MTDNLSQADRRKAMRSVPSKGTSLERILRSVLAAYGIDGWICNPSGITGNPDLVFLRERIVVFVDGCFWHSCPDCSKPLPVSNRAYWQQKIERNVKRAEIVSSALKDEGWEVLRIWGHELKSYDLRKSVIKRILSLLS